MKSLYVDFNEFYWSNDHDLGKICEELLRTGADKAYLEGLAKKNEITFVPGTNLYKRLNLIKTGLYLGIGAALGYALGQNIIADSGDVSILEKIKIIATSTSVGISCGLGLQLLVDTPSWTEMGSPHHYVLTPQTWPKTHIEKEFLMYNDLIKKYPEEVKKIIGIK